MCRLWLCAIYLHRNLHPPQIMERKQSNKRVLGVIQRKVDRSLKPALDEILKTKLSVERDIFSLS